MVAYALAALIISVLAGTGVGGGGLFILYLVSVYGTAQTNAQAINLVFFICAAAASLPYHGRHRKLHVKRILFCIAFAAAGTILGGAVRQRLPESAMRSIFGALLIITGVRTLFAKGKS